MRINVVVWMPVTLMLLVSCSGNKEKEQSKVLVKTEKAVGYSIESEQEYPFISRPYRTSELSFRVGGPIDRFDVFAGNYYKQGNILAEIDPRDFCIRKERSEAVYKQMEAEFGRIQKLYEKNNISASQYEKVRADYVTAKTAFEIASYEVEDTKLTAPFNGYVGEVYIEKFQDVKATQPVLSFIDIDRLRIETYVTQEVAACVQSLDSVEIRFDLYPNKKYKAQIVEVSKGTTRNNLSYLLTALLPNPEGKLLAGMSGKVRLNITSDSGSKGVVVSQSSLCYRPTEGDYVWVVNENNAEVNLRKVSKGNLLPDGKVVISEGLEENEVIAASGLRFLSNGMQVELSSKKN
ncbi:efflux RND transporter periplasmic adaptor subunit [Parabacteroides pacaensis]|uniref:efflux RND transporter periplasmic adaptor subunit n=1 Tax=Parabacteroides pacaensis TaxID=2086575 RepID=UPI000D10205D|nr:efflux RND transporter periplasmic adaptor subunit [Parabacteroides pacaensis]